MLKWLEITADYKCNNRCVGCFSVQDDGPGIAHEYQEQIFKMFQTLKPRDQVEGSGMGLAMVKKNIELVNEPFDECLGNILRKRDKIDFAFIDGNHRFEATQEYFLLLD